VTFEMSRATCPFYQNPTWLVEKILTPGERYLLGTFENEYRASVCLESFKASVEVGNGAEVVRG
jgi:hypothetical protein